jgi:hypothetical protein
MPNWCSNVATFGHENQAELVRLAQAFVDGNPMMTFMSPPNGEWEYGWCTENWGTKWDIENSDALDNLSEGMLDLWFDSAWGPPIGFYTHLESLGFTIEAFYYESGMGFCGKYEDGEDDYYEITGDSEWVKEHIPADLDECFAISDSMSDWEDEEKETNDE